MARPTKRTPAIDADIERWILNGATQATAAAAAGIADSTLDLWLAKDECFRARIEQAKARCKAEMVMLVTWGARKDPNLALKWLERRDPEWRPLPRQTEVSGANGGPIAHRELPPELTLAELRALAGVDANAH